MKIKINIKKIFKIITVIILLAVIAAPAVVFAAESGNYVFDETGTLTKAEVEKLNNKAAALSEKRKCGVYIWIVDLVPEEYEITIDDYGDYDMDQIEKYADMFYAKNNLGVGNDRNGMILLLEVGDEPGYRDYCITTTGSCTSVFSNSVRESLLDDKIVPLFRKAFDNGDFYKVADKFLDEVENEFVSDFTFGLIFKLAVIILVPMLIAWIVCSGWKAKMKTAKIARAADNYIPENGFRLTAKEDKFLYRTTTRTRIEKSSSSSSGGSGSSSSGRSSGGRV